MPVVLRLAAEPGGVVGTAMGQGGVQGADSPDRVSWLRQWWGDKPETSMSRPSSSHHGTHPCDRHDRVELLDTIERDVMTAANPDMYHPAIC